MSENPQVQVVVVVVCLRVRKSLFLENVFQSKSVQICWCQYGAIYLLRATLPYLSARELSTFQSIPVMLIQRNGVEPFLSVQCGGGLSRF